MKIGNLEMVSKDHFIPICYNFVTHKNNWNHLDLCMRTSHLWSSLSPNADWAFLLHTKHSIPQLWICEGSSLPSLTLTAFCSLVSTFPSCLISCPCHPTPSLPPATLFIWSDFPSLSFTCLVPALPLKPSSNARVLGRCQVKSVCPSFGHLWLLDIL